MKWLFKWALRLVLLVVALVVVLLLSKDTIFRIVIENRIRSRTGLDVKIGKYSSSIFSPVITIENLRIYNTAEFRSEHHFPHCDREPDSFPHRPGRKDREIFLEYFLAGDHDRKSSDL